MQYRQEHIRVILDRLNGARFRELGAPPAMEYVKSGYKHGHTPPAAGWQPMPEGMLLSGADGHYWLRTELKTPPAAEGQQYFLRLTTGREGWWDATNPQVLVYLNGRLAQGCDTNHTDVYLQPDTEYTVHMYYYVGPMDNPCPLRLCLRALDTRVDRLYFDLRVPFDTYRLLPADGDEATALLNVMERAVNQLDLREMGSDAFLCSVADADALLQEELYDTLCTRQGKPIVHCVGHTHIDVEWQWTRAQTREKIQRSFATAQALMERYPEYRFMLSQPELYRYLKEEAPEQYAALKQLVAEGRWEPEGAMYLEADCNLISGESFVRQILQGKRFFREEFGVDSRILFLPDVFGYSAAMPQILRKSGVDSFITSKISWNDTNKMPVDVFLWEGLDGTEIFTHFITAQEYADPPRNITTYVGHLTPSEIKGTWNRFQQKEYTRRALTTFGYGDGGGGPTREMLETYRRLEKGLPGMPAVEMGTLQPYMQALREEFDEGCRKTGVTPRWVGELYLEMHRGTYTSQAATKRHNRQAELLLGKAEQLSAVDALFGGNYDADGLYSHWTKVLHNQFHDIIPGSSIAAVYEGTERDYEAIDAYGRGVVQDKLQRIAAGVPAQNGYVLYNALGFPYAGPVTVEGITVEPEAPVPSFGWCCTDRLLRQAQVTVEDRTAENRYYRLTLAGDGSIASLYDKEARREVFRPGEAGNQLQVFEDFPRDYDNWEINEYYKMKMWLTGPNATIHPITDGSRAGFSVVRRTGKSVITQRIWLYSRCRRIDFDTEIDWQEQHQILKAAFPLALHTDRVTCEIQFGHVERPTHQNTSWDAAKFEVYAHKWVDMAEYGYGVSLLNDCKYGLSAEGSTLKLTLLKCGTYPDPHADQGRHRFTYSLLPHTGDFRQAGVIREACGLNQPLSVIPAGGDGSRPAVYSLASCDQPGVLMETVKQAESGDGWILRLYEAFGGSTVARLTLAPGFRRVCRCDLMEQELEELPMTDHTVMLPVGKFEIVTLKLFR